MNDKIEQRMERLAPEIESYQHRGIFTPKELSKIVEIRRGFEIKLQRHKKNLNDFLKYIESEKKFEKLRNRRIKKVHASFEETDSLVEKNILGIYKMALYYFNEPALLRDFAHFCIKTKNLEIMKETFAEKCLKNPKNSDLWIFCASKLWEINDLESARNTFIKSTSVNDDIRLLIEFFRFECKYAEKVNKLNQEMGVENEDKDEIEKGEVAFMVFKEIVPRASQQDIDGCIEISKIVDGLPEQIMDFISKN